MSSTLVAAPATPVVVELGCGRVPSPGATIRHDRIKHSDFVDVAHDLEIFPWPFESDSIDTLVAIDVFEHLRRDIARIGDGHDGWLDECWRVLKPGGQLVMRLPAHDNGLSWRDPTHRRVFHPETMLYFDPRTHQWQQWGSIYYAEANRWWHVESVERDAGDLGIVMTKLPADAVPRQE